MPITYRSAKGSPLTNAEVDANFRDLDERATQNQQAASGAQQEASNAGAAATEANEALTTHKAGGDHDSRYLRRDVPDTAPLLSGIPQGGIVGLSGDFDTLRTAVRRLQYGDGPFPSLDLQFVGARLLDPRIDFSRLTDGYYVNDRGVLARALPNEPRFNFDPETGRARGLLVEGAATNLAVYSNYQTGDYWVGNSLYQLAANVGRAPDRTQTLSRIAANADGQPYAGPGATTSVSYSAGKRYVSFCWFRFDSSSPARIVRLLMHGNVFGNSKMVLFNCQTGEVTAGASQFAPEKWGYKRFPGNLVLVWQVNIAINTVSSYAPLIWFNESILAGEGVGFWGVDVKEGASISSHVPTRGAASSRAEDRLSVSGQKFADWFNAEEGTLVIEADTTDDSEGQGGTRRLVSLSDGTNSNRMDLYLNSINRMTAFIAAGASTANINQSVSISRDATFRFGVAYKAGRYACATNGSPVVVDSSGLNPVGLSELRLGYSTVSGHWNGHIRRFTYFPRQFSDSELQGLTAL